MNFDYYLDTFNKAASRLDKQLFHQKQMDVETGIWLNSVVLRLQKKHWANDPAEKPHTGAAIFMSIWLNDQAVKENKLLYNIHALRLRQLRGYALTARDFAAGFRTTFKKMQHQWLNVNIERGPQTLMEGWIDLPAENLQADIAALAGKLVEIDFIIDDLLKKK